MLSPAILYSVVIPTRNRKHLTERAIASVLAQPNSDRMQIIVVDDASNEPFCSSFLRAHDQLLRNEVQCGASRSRNRGLNRADGSIIYLLDSDDLFLERDFEHDRAALEEKPGILYCDVQMERRHFDYSDRLTVATYFPSILGRQPLVGQTSTLCFSASLELRFDEELPIYEDWDLVFFALAQGIDVRRGTGRAYYDHADVNSLSKRPAWEKHQPWMRKLSAFVNSGGDLGVPLAFVKFVLTGHVNPDYDLGSWLHNYLGALVSSSLPVRTKARIARDRFLR